MYLLAAKMEVLPDQAEPGETKTAWRLHGGACGEDFNAAPYAF